MVLSWQYETNGIGRWNRISITSLTERYKLHKQSWRIATECTILWTTSQRNGDS